MLRVGGGKNKNVNFPSYSDAFPPPPTDTVCVSLHHLFKAFPILPKLESKWIIANLFLWCSCAISVSAWQSICQEPFSLPSSRMLRLWPVTLPLTHSFSLCVFIFLTSHHTLLPLNHEFDLSSLLLPPSSSSSSLLLPLVLWILLRKKEEKSHSRFGT